MRATSVRLNALVSTAAVWLVSIISSLAAVAHQEPITSLAGAIDTVFAFGDSYSTISYDPRKGVQSIPNLGGTTSGGNTWLQFLTGADSSRPIALYDLACYGAVVDDRVTYAPGFPVRAPDFVTQVALWQQFFAGSSGAAVASGQVKWRPDRTLFTIWFGINDLGVETLLVEDPARMFPRMFASMNKLVQDLYDGGARNFLFLTLPPTQRAPGIALFKDYPTVSLYGPTIDLYNGALTSFTTTLASSHPDITVTLFDAHAVFTEILDNPTAFGFADATTFCPVYRYIDDLPHVALPQCPLPLAKYVWRDGTHPTWRVHEILASKLSQALASRLTASLLVQDSTSDAGSPHLAAGRPLRLFLSVLVLCFAATLL
ncbi:hypothetical protein JCM8202v2_006327 [Rhodotorula sphaerocarpa]